MLTLNSTNKVTFSVNVHGTSATPTVRCVVGEYPGCMYSATKLSENKYEVLIDLPATMRAGAHDFKVEVVLNGRLFTPINTKIDVVGGFENSVSDERIAELEPAAVQPLEPVLKHAATKTDEAIVAPAAKESLFKVVTKKDEPKEPPRKITKPADKPVKRPPYVKPAEPAEPVKIPPKPAMNALEAVAKAPVEKRKPKNEPKAAPAAPTKPVSFSMKDVANEAVQREPAPVAPEPQVTVEQVTSIPISLTKGEVIYK